MEEELLTIQDVDLIQLLRQNESYLGVVYENNKDYCISFMRGINYGNYDEDILEDVFTDAIIILLEKIRQVDFVLTASLRTFLAAICRFQFLNRVREERVRAARENVLNFENDDFENDDFENDGNGRRFDFESFGENILDFITNGRDRDRDRLQENIVRMTRSLEQIRLAGGNCYELITLFSYENLSISDLTRRLGYANDNSTKNQKSRCMSRLRILTRQIN
jgi:DNA-directed RNA polymerase specialized sigma24 family protein